MMYVKIVDNEVEAFPYSIDMLRADNHNIGLPERPSKELLESYGCYEVRSGNTPSEDRLTHTIMQGSAPVQRDGIWFLDYVAERKTQEQAERNIRGERDFRLSATDWIIIKHQELGTAIPSDWLTYRSALRDVPSQHGFPYDITWPNQPEA
jgi:hypothetical protein